MVRNNKYPPNIASTIIRLCHGLLGQKILKKTMPWMKPPEIDIIQWLLTNLKPQACLEWGCGGSTLYFQRFLCQDALWISIEHGEGWADKIIWKNKRPKTRIFHVAPNHFPWSDIESDGSYSDLHDYVDFSDKHGLFDFVLVDGRARKDCLIKAREILAEDGIVILHDAQRTHYHSSLGLFKHQIMLTGYGGGSLWIGSKSLDVRLLIDGQKCATLWRGYEFIHKLLWLAWRLNPTKIGFKL